MYTDRTLVLDALDTATDVIQEYLDNQDDPYVEKLQNKLCKILREIKRTTVYERDDGLCVDCGEHQAEAGCDFCGKSLCLNEDNECLLKCWECRNYCCKVCMIHGNQHNKQCCVIRGSWDE